MEELWVILQNFKSCKAYFSNFCFDFLGACWVASDEKYHQQLNYATFACTKSIAPQNVITSVIFMKLLSAEARGRYWLRWLKGEATPKRVPHSDFRHFMARGRGFGSIYRFPGNINTYFSLRTKCWVRGWVGRQFLRNLNWSRGFR